MKKDNILFILSLVFWMILGLVLESIGITFTNISFWIIMICVIFIDLISYLRGLDK